MDEKLKSKAASKGSRTKAHQPEIELVPDAWPRFENFIREIVKAGPQHRKKPAKRKSELEKPKDK
jgi:hypothetical protein